MRIHQRIQLVTRFSRLSACKSELTKVDVMTHGFPVSIYPSPFTCACTLLVGHKLCHAAPVRWTVCNIDFRTPHSRLEIRKNGTVPCWPSGESSQCLRNSPAGPAGYQLFSHTDVVPRDTPADQIGWHWRQRTVAMRARTT